MNDRPERNRSAATAATALTSPPRPETRPGGDEHRLVAAVLAGDESAFAALVDAHSSWMMRIALLHAPSRAVAEEVVQEAWLNVIRALDRFEGRSSFRTWLFTIVVNAARKQASRERRSTAFSSLASPNLGGTSEDALVDRMFDGSHPRWANMWSTVVVPWDRLPEERAVSREVVRTIETAARGLPPAQRAVFHLRDREGWSAAEVCNALELSDSNQRVLLHRARLTIREALERYFDHEDRA